MRITRTYDNGLVALAGMDIRRMLLEAPVTVSDCVQAGNWIWPCGKMARSFRYLLWTGRYAPPHLGLLLPGELGFSHHCHKMRHNRDIVALAFPSLWTNFLSRRQSCMMR